MRDLGGLTFVKKRWNPQSSERKPEPFEATGKMASNKLTFYILIPYLYIIDTNLLIIILFGLLTLVTTNI